MRSLFYAIFTGIAQLPMKRIFLPACLLLLMLLSCNKTDCPDKIYELRISLGNDTEYEIDVQLYPKAAFLSGSGLYRVHSIGGGYSYPYFTMEPYSPGMWSYEYHLYTTHDTTFSPSALLAHVFDSIAMEVYDSTGTRIFFSPDTLINYTQNPYTCDTIWEFMLQETGYPDNDCENWAQRHAYRYFIGSGCRVQGAGEF